MPESDNGEAQRRRAGQARRRDLRRAGPALMAVVLIVLVLAWDLLSVYAPGFMGRAVTAGGTVPVGVLGALLLLLFIMLVAVLYGYAGERESPPSS